MDLSSDLAPMGKIAKIGTKCRIFCHLGTENGVLVGKNGIFRFLRGVLAEQEGVCRTEREELASGNGFAERKVEELTGFGKRASSLL